MKEQGARLRKYLKREGIKFVVAAQRLGIHVNTLHNWMAQESLELGIFGRLARVWPDIMEEFPEVEWRRIGSDVRDSASVYLTMAEAETQRKFQELSDRYTQLLERYNALLEKYVLLQIQQPPEK